MRGHSRKQRKMRFLSAWLMERKSGQAHWRLKYQKRLMRGPNVEMALSSSMLWPIRSYGSQGKQDIRGWLWNAQTVMVHVNM